MVLIYDMDFLDIPLQDLPDEEGHAIVCLDPQKRLGEETWAVLKSSTGDYDYPSPKGLFWDKDMAIKFAETISEE